MPCFRQQQPQPQPQPQAGQSAQTNLGTDPVGDPLAFLSVLPDSGVTAAGLGDPSLFFAGMGMEMGQPDTAPLGTNIFGSSFGGEFGDQWTSLMRETGFFDAQGNFKTDGLVSPTTPTAGQQGHARQGSGDIFPSY